MKNRHCAKQEILSLSFSSLKSQEHFEHTGMFLKDASNNWLSFKWDTRKPNLFPNRQLVKHAFKVISFYFMRHQNEPRQSHSLFFLVIKIKSPRPKPIKWYDLLRTQFQVKGHPVLLALILAVGIFGCSPWSDHLGVKVKSSKSQSWWDLPTCLVGSQYFLVLHCIVSLLHKINSHSSGLTSNSNVNNVSQGIKSDSVSVSWHSVGLKTANYPSKSIPECCHSLISLLVSRLPSYWICFHFSV